MGDEHEEFLRRLASRKISRRDLLEICAKLGLSAAVAGPILAACGGGAATPAATEPSGAGATGTPAATGAATEVEGGELTDRQKTLVLAYQRDGSNIDPAIYWECEESDVVGALYDNMIATKWIRADDSIELVPQLARNLGTFPLITRRSRSTFARA